MKNWIHLPIAAAVAALIGFGSTLFSSARHETRGASSDEVALRTALAELQAEQRALAERLAALPASPAPAANRAPALDLDAAIAAYMARQVGAADDAPGRRAGPADAESAAIAERILSGEVRGDALEALWQELRQTKRIDGVVAEIEAQAALAPRDPDLQNELGKAYIQKLFDVGIGPVAAAWGEKADRAFDQALALDDTHWEARFHKAIALSNWPAFLGKQGEAMRHFEILMEQQEHLALSPEQAMTYTFLGNLYDQNGDRAKALAVWKRGAARFPGNADLAQKAGAR